MPTPEQDTHLLVVSRGVPPDQQAHTDLPHRHLHEGWQPGEQVRTGPLPTLVFFNHVLVFRA